MSFNHDVLVQCPLFKNINPQDFPLLLKCLKYHTKNYHPGEFIFSLGDQVNAIGILLSGRLEIVKEQLSGHTTILTFIEPTQLFAEGIVCTQKRVSPISVHVATPSSVLFIPYENIIKSCGNACTFHTQLIRNMLSILGEKNMILNTKMDLLILKGIQEKLITYLLNEARKNNSLSFTLPLNRNQLAAFLNVSRPSMCRELAQLKSEHLIDYYKNDFKLLDIDALRKKLIY